MDSARKKPFTLTRDNGKLSLGQRIFYEENGFILFPRLMPMDVLKKCDQRFEEIASGKIPKGTMIVMKDVKDRKSVNKIQDFVFDDVLKEYIEHKDILDVVESFTGPNIMAMHTMLIAKPPDVGFGSSRHPPHQDLYYFPFRSEDKIVAAWTAIEECNIENGCLYVLPGSHKKYPLLPHVYPPGSVNKLYHGIQDLKEPLNWVYLKMDPGDTVFFHPKLIHGSGVNKSKGTRKAISAHYAASDCHYIEVDGTVQQSIKEEVLEVAKRKYPGVEINFADVWRIKSGIVRGIRSSL
ncbi:phytanoyl-CoA dioxygenase, peroxisomal-like [Leptopilina heterotoma]|uniref:phytanoyl-CoA dioxygenase, peroxisomal-like n=1 Tax=Leptopilina heterotoma TaxID=63436 RepID=UPI001CA8F293|nr:phytanoyl-CoA dioxygenase, peroxisomal-like [Leptopilina heterotoma]XP_043484625.1 phytanoyl-CoA dioxygenase, peroxisomal-like [Leptopilina heterotoma]XP_043484626.1 phytanoyl-CoA dioxygenase, peroxisomal-like [Leptopilina heterotoma]XP_043484627.1 phytanoyl-CoA dioxygenase, peroxisomal-like [Leptopilina heterotoma]XP_043484628.1 phytanoyl-CoA dioxygenase, peroxisomal-like [Leptopilina heterotoma]